MNRRSLLAALAAFSAAPLAAAADPASSSLGPPPGQMFVRPFASAPFPHPSRANGFDYQGTHFSAKDSYSDSSVGIYVPTQFRPSQTVDLIVHFHGWGASVAKVMVYYNLPWQLEASRRNAILVVPQGPKFASDSGDGKIELDDRGFARFVSDILAFLQYASITNLASLGKIVITAHSGGYGAVGGLLTRGGMNASITDVLLFDALFGYFDAFENWVAADPTRHFLSLYIADSAADNVAVAAKMQTPQRNPVMLDAATMTPAQLQTRAPTFILTDVAHDDLPQKWYETLLRTTALSS